MAAVTLTSKDIQVTFQLGHYTTNQNSIKIKDLTKYSDNAYTANGTVAVLVYFTVVNPNGTTLFTGSFDSPHISGHIQADGYVTDAVDTYESAANTLLLSNDAFIEGSYTITTYFKVNGADTDSLVETVNMAYTKPTPSMTRVVDCGAATLKSTDATDYTILNTVEAITRTHKVVYPPSSGIDTISGSAVTITMADPLYSGSVSQTLSSLVTWDYNNKVSQDWHVWDKIVDEVTEKVGCNYSLKEIATCIDSVYTAYKAAQSTNITLANRLLARWDEATRLMAMYRDAREYDQDKAATYYDELLKVTNCADTCGSCNKTTPQRITPLGGNITSSTFTFNGGSYIDITESPSNTFTFDVNNTSLNSTLAATNITTDSGITTTEATEDNFTIRPTAGTSRMAWNTTLIFNGADADNITVSTADVNKWGDAFDGTPVVSDPADGDVNLEFTVNSFANTTRADGSTSITANDNYKATITINEGGIDTDTQPAPLYARINSKSNGSFTFNLCDRTTGLPLTAWGITKFVGGGDTTTLILAFDLKE